MMLHDDTISILSDQVTFPPKDIALAEDTVSHPDSLSMELNEAEMTFEPGWKHLRKLAKTLTASTGVTSQDRISRLTKDLETEIQRLHSLLGPLELVSPQLPGRRVLQMMCLAYEFLRGCSGLTKWNPGTG